MRIRLNAVMAAVLAVGSLAFANPAQLFTSSEHRTHEHKQQQGDFSEVLAAELPDGVGPSPCIDGMAADLFACDGVDLLRYIPVSTLDNSPHGDSGSLKIEGSDVWGWTSEAGEDYVIMGKTNSTAFFRLTDPTDPTYLGELPNPGSQFSVWKDMKVSGDWVYIVAEAADHGMQVFDLTKLEPVRPEDGDAPATFEADAHYLQESNNSHNIVVNPDSNRAYIVGSVGTASNPVEDVLCDRGGLHEVDIADPTNPTFGGCYTADLYVHDAQCVTYDGPDARFTGHEICFAANEDWMSIVDMTDPALPIRLAVVLYDGASYVHQGWLTEDHRFFLLGDEGDERSDGHNTRTMIVDVSDLLLPGSPIEHFGPTPAIDHNMYTHEGLLYQSNYAAGFRLLTTAGLYEGTPSLEEIAYFDLFPDDDSNRFVGTWSNYPYFGDGIVVVNAYDGLFILQLHDDVLAQRFDPTQ